MQKTEEKKIACVIHTFIFGLLVQFIHAAVPSHPAHVV
jgi:hypothetical protein